MKSVDAFPDRKTTNQSAAANERQSCCSSPAAMAFWFVASLVAWGLLSLVGMYWHPLRALSATTIYVAAGAGCCANWLRNRTFHCGITAPLLLVAGLVSLLAEINFISVDTRFIWPFVVIGITVGFFLEWRYAGRSR
jgi:hypothetical protein